MQEARKSIRLILQLTVAFAFSVMVAFLFIPVYFGEVALELLAAFVAIATAPFFFLLSLLGAFYYTLKHMIFPIPKAPSKSYKLGQSRKSGKRH